MAHPADSTRYLLLADTDEVEWIAEDAGYDPFRSRLAWECRCQSEEFYGDLPSPLLAKARYVHAVAAYIGQKALDPDFSRYDLALWAAQTRCLILSDALVLRLRATPSAKAAEQDVNPIQATPNQGPADDDQDLH